MALTALVSSDATGPSGVADYARLLARALADRGYATADGNAESVDVAVYNFTPYASGVYLGWLRGVLSAGRLRRRATRFAVVFHEVFELPDARMRMRVFAFLQRWATSRLDRMADVTVVSDAARGKRLAALCPTAKCPVIVPVGPSIPVPDRPTTPDGTTVVVFGLLHDDRDLETVVRAVAHLRHDVPTVHLRVIGDFGDNPARHRSLEALIAEIGAPVALEGVLDEREVAAAFAGARVFVSTYTRSVSLGSTTIADAFGYGLPVVVYEHAALHPELIPGTTVMTAPRSAEGLARAIETVLGEAGDAIGAAGRAVYERELTWPAIAERFDELLRP